VSAAALRLRPMPSWPEVEGGKEGAKGGGDGGATSWHGSACSSQRGNGRTLAMRSCFWSSGLSVCARVRWYSRHASVLTRDHSLPKAGGGCLCLTGLYLEPGLDGLDGLVVFLELDLRKGQAVVAWQYEREA
jgi:hypothetical protein